MHSGNLSKYLYRSIVVGLYLALLTPFIYIDNLVFPFITGKVFIFQILVTILSAAYIILVLLDKSYLPRKSWLLIAASLFLVTFVVSSFTGVDFERSFWGNFERMNGTFSILHFFAFFYILAGIFKSKKDWIYYLSVAVVLSGVEASIGIMQFYSKNFFLAQGGGRIWGTLGNFIYMATYSLFHIFIGLWLMHELYNSETGKNLKKWGLAALGTLIILNFSALYLSGTRGGYLGFIAGLALSLFIFVFTSNSKKIKFISGSILIIFFLVFGAVILSPGNKIISKLPMIGSIANSLVSLSQGADTGSTRLIGWEIALKAWKEKPLLGWGPENYYYAFNKFYNPKSLEKGFYETWFDRPHNMPLEILSTQGSLGALLYLSIFVLALILPIISYKKSKISATDLIFPLGGLAAYFTQNLFAFDTPSSSLLFFILIALFHNFSTRERYETPISAAKNDHLKKIKKGENTKTVFAAGGLLSLGVLALIYIGTVEPWTAGVETIKGEREIVANFPKAYKFYKDAIEIGTPYTDEITISLARIMYEKGDNNSDFVKENVERYKFVVERLKEFIKDHESDVFAHMALGQIYGTMAQVDDSYYSLAEAAFNKSLEFSPSRQQIYFMWARIYVRRREFDKAHELLTQAINLNSNVAESLWYKGLVYLAEEDDENALNYLEKAFKLNYSFNTRAEAIALGRLYENKGELDKIPPILLRWISASTEDAPAHVLLAQIYERLNDRSNYEKYIGKALELDSDVLVKMNNTN